MSTKVIVSVLFGSALGALFANMLWTNDSAARVVLGLVAFLVAVSLLIYIDQNFE